MALTFAITDLSRDVTSKRIHRGTITLTGTTTDDGDAITAAALGLSVIEDLVFKEAFLDSTSNPENAFLGTWNKNSGKIVFHTAHGTPGGAVPLLQVTDGTTLTNYFSRFEAVGR